MTVPRRVVEEDRRLNETAMSAQEHLARLRWRWTLDETNPDRVSFRAYGEAVGRSGRTINSMAKGYADWLERESPLTSLTDCIELAKLGAERGAATEAVAEAMGLSVTAVASGHRDKVKETIRSAHDAAERRGTAVEEEIPRIAQAHERQRQSAERQRVEAKKKHTLRYVQIEAHLAAAKGRLVQALSIARDVELDDEETELIADTVRQVVAVLRLIDVRFTGASGTDWETEKNRLLDDEESTR